MERIADALERMGVSEYEIFYQEETEQPVSFEQNVLEELELKTKRGVGVRVIKDGKLGFTASSDLRDPEAVARAAIQAAEFGPEAAISFPGPGDFPELSFEGGSWPVEERLKRGKELISDLSALVAGIMVNFTASEISLKRRIINSRGLDVSYEKPLFMFYIYLTGMTDVGYIADGGYRYYTKVPEIAEVTEPLRQRIKRAMELDKISPGKKKVILAPGVMNLLAMSLEMGLDGKNVVKGSSPLRDKLGERILGEGITLREDPLHPYLAGSGPFDAEGVATRPRVIVERGVLREFNLDLWSGAKLGKPSTASADRDYGSPPRAAFSNLIMEPGETPLEDIIASVDEGLIVYGTIGGGQSNMMAGDFSFNVGMGFAIKNGEISGRLKNTMVAGNFYELSQRITGLSRETEAHGTQLFPYVLFDGVSVSVKE